MNLEENVFDPFKIIFLNVVLSVFIILPNLAILRYNTLMISVLYLLVVHLFCILYLLL